MHSKYNLATVKPDIDVLFRAASGGDDILFDWVAVEIPSGTCVLKSVQGTIMGVDGAAGNNTDIQLFFAKSINGVAPATFGTVHAATSATISAAFRRNIIGHLHLDGSSTFMTDMVGYNVVGGMSSQSADNVSDGGYGETVCLQGEPHVTRKGFQTIYVAAMCHGSGQSYSTEVDLNMAGNQAASTTAVQITTSGTDPRTVFQPGDIVIGHTGTVEMEVVSVDSATTMTVKNVTAQIDHQEELILKNPIDLRLGLEY